MFSVFFCILAEAKWKTWNTYLLPRYREPPWGGVGWAPRTYPAVALGPERGTRTGKLRNPGQRRTVWQDLASDQLTALDAPKALDSREAATLGARERDFLRFGVRKSLFF